MSLAEKTIVVGALSDRPRDRSCQGPPYCTTTRSVRLPPSSRIGTAQLEVDAWAVTGTLQELQPALLVSVRGAIDTAAERNLAIVLSTPP
jgi:hypothetical protein